MEQALLQDDPPAVVDVRIGQVDGENGVVVAEIGAEQQRLHAVDQHLEMRQIAGVEIEEAVRSAMRGADIAVAVEHDEAVAMLHGSPRPRRRFGRRNVERLRLCRTRFRNGQNRLFIRHASQFRRSPHRFA
jgi:hypothetical protein